MKIINEIKGIEKQVKSLLTEFKELRDSDNQLVSKIWETEIQFLHEKSVLKALHKNLLTSYTSISRCRRKLQEVYPELRGKKYKLRHKEEKDVREMIVNM